MRTPDLWTFALACYASPGVETACLELQNQGADVCLLLCGAWLQARGVACSQARLQALTALAAPWRGDVIEPLRGLRQAWRSQAEQDLALHSLREAMKALELQAERELLERLQKISQDWPSNGAADAWLEPLVPVAHNRAALEVLRSAALQTQLELAAG